MSWWEGTLLFAVGVSLIIAYGSTMIASIVSLLWLIFFPSTIPEGGQVLIYLLNGWTWGNMLKDMLAPHKTQG